MPSKPPSPWEKLFGRVAVALNCLPSCSVDGNGHVVRRASELESIVAEQSERIRQLEAAAAEALGNLESNMRLLEVYGGPNRSASARKAIERLDRVLGKPPIPEKTKPMERAG